MSDRRNRPANRWGCKPAEDVCVAHDAPLVCAHGCGRVLKHACTPSDYQPLRPYRLERSDRHFGTVTFTTEESARKSLSLALHGGTFGFKPGTKWRLTKRLNKSGSKVEVIAEGVMP